jgi:hypothetical protein
LYIRTKVQSMGYLVITDYKKIIQTDNLNQILGSDYSLLTSIESMAESELKSYLVQKYDTSKEFVPFQIYNSAVFYLGYERLYLDAPAFNVTASYIPNELVLYNGNVYAALTNVSPGIWDITDWLYLGSQYTLYYVDPSADVFDYYKSYAVGDHVWFNGKTYTCVIANSGNNPDANAYYWGIGNAILIPSVDLLFDGNAFVKGDNRNQQMVTYMTDVALYHLHSRIAPRNIPDLRVKRYDDAIAWLKQCAKGDDITANLPKIQPTQGMRNRYGSVLPKQNNNF